MRTALLVATILLTLPTAAFAQAPAIQQETPAPRQPRAPVPGPNAEPGVPQGEKTKAPDFSVEQNMPRLSTEQVVVIGTKLRNEGGETLGTVDNLIMDREGHVISLIIGVDKLLGLAEDKVEIEWKQVRFERKDADASFITALSKDELRGLAKFTPPKRQGS